MAPMIHPTAKFLIDQIYKCKTEKDLRYLGTKIAGDFNCEEEWVQHKLSVERVTFRYKEQLHLIRIGKVQPEAIEFKDKEELL